MLPTKEVRVQIDIKDSQGKWFTVFNYPTPGDSLVLPADAPGRLAELIQETVQVLLDQKD